MLTPKRERFCQEYTVDLNATGAARRAGYSEATAHVQGPRLLANVRVASRVAALQREVAKRNEIKVDDVIAMLLESYKDAKAANQHGPAVRAVELLGKRLGMFRDKVEVSEVRAALDEIRANAWIPRHIGAEQVGEETRCERREYADAHDAGFASSECPRVDRRMTYLSDGFARPDEEPLACMSEIDAAVMANEKSCPDFVF